MRRRRAVARGADAWVVAVTLSCSSYSGQKTYNNSTISGWGRPMEAGNLFLLRPIVIRMFNPKQPPPPPSLPPRLPFSFPPSFRVSSNLQRGYRGSKPRREWVADWVSRNAAAMRGLPIYVGTVSLLAVLVNRGISGIAPVADASRRSSCNRLETKELQLLVEIRLGDLRLLTRKYLERFAETSTTMDQLNVVINSYREGLVSHPDVTLEDLNSIEILNLHLSQLRLKWQTNFMWQDGPLVYAMKNGDLLLVDEISLADDSVLKRLNSVLELERKLSLAEEGGIDLEKITAHLDFMILATMR